MSGRILANPPVLCIRSIREDEVGGTPGPRAAESPGEDQTCVSSQHPQAGAVWPLSSPGEEQALRGMCVASTYHQLSLEQSFPNGMSKPPGPQLAAWFGRIPFSFPMFYGSFFFPDAFQRAFLQASILYCSACTPRKDKYFQCVS